MQTEAYAATVLHEQHHWWYRARRELIAGQLARAASELGGPQRRLSLLDYGCGSGLNLGLLAEHGDAVGFEPAGSEYSAAVPGSRIDRDELAARAASFDLVAMLDVLEHLDDDERELAEVGRLLAPGGQLLLTVPAYDWLWGDEDVLSHHRRRYTQGRLTETAALAGFAVTFISYFNLTLLPLQAALVWGRRVLTSGALRANLTALPRAIDETLYRISSLEAHTVGHRQLSLPAGGSLVCRLRRQPEPRA